MPKVHVCLLSDQLLPNLIPILMDRPARAYLVVSKEMTAKGQDRRLRRLLRGQGIEVRSRPGAPSTDMSAIRRCSTKLASEIARAEIGNQIVLNATGGTKLLSMGFVEVFRERLEGYPLRVVYTDTAHQCLQTLVPRNVPAIRLQSVLDVPTYLAAQGMRVTAVSSDSAGWRERACARRPVTEFLGENAETLDGFIGAINRLVNGTPESPGALSGGMLVKARQAFDRKPRGLWREALTRIANGGLVTWDGAAEIHFADAESARYLGGGWLEEYVWRLARDVDFQHVACGVIGRWEGESGAEAPTNEFDLLIVHDNRLLVVECKTLKLGRERHAEQRIVDHLETLARNAGGLFATSLLVCARPATTTLRSRCRALHVALREGANGLRQLHDDLSRWRDAGRLRAQRTPSSSQRKSA